MQFSAEPLIALTYRALLEASAAWPNVNIPGTIVVPDTPLTTYNYTETLQDQGISIFNAENGVSVMKLCNG